MAAESSGDSGRIYSRRVFIMNTIPPQGIGAMSLLSDGMAPILCEESVLGEYSSG